MADADLFPPAPFDVAMERFREHNAWWTGDTATLQEIYSGAPSTHSRAGVPYRGGVVGSLSKMFWGTPIPQGEKRVRVHAPLAAQLATLSADLLFSEPPTIRYPKPADAPEAAEGEKPKPWKHPQQDRLDLIMGSDETHAELLKAGEYAAALGGSFLAVVWDAQIADRVWLQAYPADCAIPTFKYGRLVSCLLWSEFRPEGNEVFRLLEVHDPGTIRFELHRGTEKTLGPSVPLSTLSETAHYDMLRSAAELDAALKSPGSLPHEVVVSTGIPDLAVAYIPNLLPQREWRKLGTLANLGRSDFAGVEDQLDKYDEVWTSLMRDVALGKGRIIVPQSWLEQGARGEGATFDPDREVYSPVNALGKGDETVGGQAKDTQFDIRVEEHLATLDAIKREIARAIGYSEAHLGIRDSATSQQTATEITADFTDSERTRDKKAMHVKPALARIARAAVGIDGVVFPQAGGAWVEELPEIDFPPVSQQDLEKATRIVQSAFLSESMSRRERVKNLHPEWDDEQIDAEVEQVEAEFAALAPDPADFTADPMTADGARPIPPVEGEPE